jgi:PilZ domain
MRERRKGIDRRDSERLKANIEIEWEGLVGKKKGTISDLSAHGCFILCTGEVDDGEQIKILFPLTDGRKIIIWGEVVNHVIEIGCALRFIELSKVQREFLEVFVDTLKED